MHAHERARETLNKLLAATQNGKAAWEYRERRRESMFGSEQGPDFVCVTDGFRWTVERHSPRAAPDRYRVRLDRVSERAGTSFGYAEEQLDLIYEVEAEDGAEDTPYGLLRDLWEAAYQSATHWDEAFERIDAVLEAAP